MLRSAPLAAGCAGGFIIACLTGCTGALNASDDLLATEPLPGLLVAPAGFATNAGADSDGQSRGQWHDSPSLRVGAAENGWDRRHWDPVVVAIPRGQTEAQPTGVGRIPIDRELPRQRGVYPVDAEVLDRIGDPGVAALDAAVNLAAAPGLLLVGPAMRWIAEGVLPWTTVAEPPAADAPFCADQFYERVPQPSRRTPWPWIGIKEEP